MEPLLVGRKLYVLFVELCLNDWDMASGLDSSRVALTPIMLGERFAGEFTRASAITQEFRDKREKFGAEGLVGV